jgi:hypothetical protein
VIPRRLAAVAVAALAVFLAPASVRAGPSPAGTATQPATAGQAQLTLDPQSGTASASFTATYAYNQACPQGALLRISWNGEALAAVRPGGRTTCGTAVRGLTPPADANQAGPYDVQAVLLSCSTAQSCAPVPNGQADQTYTVVADSTAPPTIAPATAAPTSATAPPTPAPTPTPLATALPIGAGGTFAPYDCRNGIPDSTPCPSPISAVAAVVTGPPGTAAPATPPAPSSGPPLPSRSVIALGAAILASIAGAVVLLGWRQGATARRSRLARNGVPARRPRTTPAAASVASSAAVVPDVDVAVDTVPPPPHSVAPKRVPPPPSAPRPPAAWD